LFLPQVSVGLLGQDTGLSVESSIRPLPKRGRRIHRFVDQLHVSHTRIRARRASGRRQKTILAVQASRDQSIRSGFATLVDAVRRHVGRDVGVEAPRLPLGGGTTSPALAAGIDDKKGKPRRGGPHFRPPISASMSTQALGTGWSRARVYPVWRRLATQQGAKRRSSKATGMLSGMIPFLLQRAGGIALHL
jgi:hypothetical protein